MKAQWTGWGTAGIVGLFGMTALSAAALALAHAPATEQVNSAGQHYVLPASAEISHTLLADGRTLEIYGAQAQAFLVDGVMRRRVPLPESRRFASVTVMPSGQVLLWGGIDAHGQVLDTGEWFDPTTERFVRTGLLGLPARAGHTLSVLTDGQVLMAGGWTATGMPATTVVLWQPASHQSTTLTSVSEAPRLVSQAQMQADGSVQIAGGVDAKGHAIYSTLQFQPTTQQLSLVAAQVSVPDNQATVAATLPSHDSTAAPIQGPLAVRFATPVDVRQLNTTTVTLLGPEGTVPVHVIGAEGGRLAFVQLPDDLYPGSRYTLFMQGLHTAAGAAVPYTAVGFTTAQVTTEGVVMAGQGSRRAPSVTTADTSASPPLYLMAGDGQASCTGRNADQLCREHSFIRDGAWYPGKNNAPDFTGAHWRLYQPHQGLPDTHALEASLAKGSTALIGQIRQIDEAPVANVEVSIGGIKARTDERGVFVLTGLPVGRQEVFVDGRTASHGDINYGRFLVGADIKAKAIGHMPFVMYLPRVLPRDEIALPSPTTREVVLTHPDMPGLELHVPAGTVFKDREGHVLTHIAIVPTPVDHAPFPLPDNFPMYFTIQPGDAVVQGLTPDAAKGIRVVYPNYGHAKPDAAGSFWVYDVQQGWKMYGGGHVTADAKHVAPDPGVSLVWAMGAGVSLSNASAPNKTAEGNKCAGDPIDQQTGTFFHEWNDLSISDIVPLTVNRAYNSADTASHVFGVGGNANFGIHLYSSDGTFTQPVLVMPCGQGIAFNLVNGTSANWPLTGDVWMHTATNSSFYGATLQFFTGTPIGEYWQLTMKDGTEYGFQSDVPNQLKWVQDRYGNVLQLAYNGGLVDQMISPSGRFITLNYDSSNRVSSAVDNTGRTVSYVYNAAGGLATVTYPDKTTEQYTYDSNKRMLTMQDRRGNTAVTNQYDTNGRVVKQTQADSTFYQFAYTTDSNNNVTATTITDPNSNQEQVAFDPVSHYPASDTYAYGTPLAETTTYVREASGLVDSATDALGRTTTFTHDALGNVTQLTRLAGTSSAVSYQFTYTSDYNQLASATDPLGHTTTLGYTNGCLTSVADALGHSAVIVCNAAGQVTSIQDALGNTTTFGYQGYDLQSVTDALGRTLSYTVDVLGRRTATRDPIGNVTLGQYDTNDRLAQITDGLNQTTAVSYDGNGNLLNVTLPSGAVITTSYDNRNRPVTRTDALQQNESWTYDARGDVLSYTDRTGQATQYSYDALNRRTLISYADGSGIQASYDTGNRLTGLLDSMTGSLSWSYDGLNHIIAATTPQGTISYAYDAAGRRTSMAAAAQASVSYGYDNADRLITLSQGSETVQFGYDLSNRRTTLTLPNGVIVNYSYDVADQLSGISYVQGNGTAVGNITYNYDADGHRIGQTGTLAPNVLPAPTTQPGTFDLNNRQTGFNGQALSYDSNGNLTSDGTNTYTWNARHQLTQISQGGTAQLSYSYDALGRRIAKTVSGSTATQYLYDGANTVQETQGSAVNPILSGLGIDERFARNDVTGRTYFLADALGSTIGLTDPTGALREQYQYDPYGNVTPSDTTTGFTNPYQYTGREADTAGLYYYRARYYSPGMGRFIGEDPMGFGGGQSNFYAYVGGNSLSYRDPTGRYFGLDDGAALGIGAVVGLASQGFSDLIEGHLSSWQDYAGSAIGGAAAGEASLYLGPLATGAVFGGATNLAKQGLKMATGKQCHFHLGSLATDTALGAAFGGIAGPEMPGITSGRGSYASVFKQMVTKQSNGTIDDISGSTAMKMAASKQAEGLSGSALGPVGSAIEDTVMPDDDDGCECQ